MSAPHVSPLFWEGQDISNGFIDVCDEIVRGVVVHRYGTLPRKTRKEANKLRVRMEWNGTAKGSLRVRYRIKVKLK